MSDCQVDEEQLQGAIEAVKKADAILVTAGAGMGVDSGLPDFRGNEGFWTAYPAYKKRRLAFTEMANPKWFDAKPEIAWGFYGHRLNMYCQTTPHTGFQLLQDIIATKELPGFVFTSNVDGQFQKSGFSDEQVWECHGSIHHLQCAQACTDRIWHRQEVDGLNVIVDEETFEADIYSIPRCPNKCGAVLRPNILMFGDWNWIGERTDSQEAAYRRWWSKVKDHSVTVIEIGAGTSVPTVRYHGQRIAKHGMNSNSSKRDENGAAQHCLVRINPREPEINISSVQGLQLGTSATAHGFSLAMGGLHGIQAIADGVLEKSK